MGEQAMCDPDFEVVKNYLAPRTNFGKFVRDDDESIESDLLPSVDYYSHLDCSDDALWRDTGDSAIDGQVKPYETCYFRCKDGFHMERGKCEGAIKCWRRNSADLFAWHIMAFTN